MNSWIEKSIERSIGDPSSNYLSNGHLFVHWNRIVDPFSKHSLKELDFFLGQTSSLFCCEILQISNHFGQIENIKNVILEKCSEVTRNGLAIIDNNNFYHRQLGPPSNETYGKMDLNFPFWPHLPQLNADSEWDIWMATATLSVVNFCVDVAMA